MLEYDKTFDTKPKNSDGLKRMTTHTEKLAVCVKMFSFFTCQCKYRIKNRVEVTVRRGQNLSGELRWNFMFLICWKWKDISVARTTSITILRNSLKQIIWQQFNSLAESHSSRVIHAEKWPQRCQTSTVVDTARQQRNRQRPKNGVRTYSPPSVVRYWITVIWLL